MFRTFKFGTFTLVCLCAMISSRTAPAQDSANKLIEQLSVFEPLLGKSFRGKFADSTPEKPVVDVSKWERALNGKAVRMLHSINDGAYGGETIMMWDDGKKKIAYWYFTTAGFHTEGTMEVNGKTWTSMEEVTGSAGGVTKVKATSTLKDDGSLHVKSEYFKDNQWVPGHEVTYQQSSDAKVIFK